MMKSLRKILVCLGYKPWIRCSIVSAWNDYGIARVMYCTRDGYEDLYVNHGLKCLKALEFETKRITDKNYIIMERSKIPADKKYRDKWVVNYARKRIDIMCII